MVKRAMILCAAIAACVPEVPDDTSLVTSPRLLGVRVEPAEVAPAAKVTARALWVAPDGVAAAPLAWAFCTARKPITEPGTVDPSCLDPSSPDLSAFGAGATAAGSVPLDACRLFGPDRPDAKPGEPAGRPVDPDGTGGYYQPIRIGAGDLVAIDQVRITCGLPTATPAQAAEFATRRHPNTNPSIAQVTADGAALVPLEVDANARASVAPGARVHLVVTWPACAADERPCDGAESYVWYDPDARELTTRREAMRVSWFATAGAYDQAHSGRGEAEADTAYADDTWTAPASGDALLWIVLRDDRGGATWASFRVAAQ
jgi:hypothetical protein